MLLLSVIVWYRRRSWCDDQNQNFDGDLLWRRVFSAREREKRESAREVTNTKLLLFYFLSFKANFPQKDNFCKCRGKIQEAKSTVQYWFLSTWYWAVFFLFYQLFLCFFSVKESNIELIFEIQYHWSLFNFSKFKMGLHIYSFKIYYWGILTMFSISPRIKLYILFFSWLQHKIISFTKWDEAKICHKRKEQVQLCCCCPTIITTTK